MPAKLSTTISKIKLIPNSDNSVIISKFHDFMKYNDLSEKHQNNNLKTIVSFSKSLDKKSFREITKKEDILSFLQTKIKSKEDNSEQK